MADGPKIDDSNRKFIDFQHEGSVWQIRAKAETQLLPFTPELFRDKFNYAWHLKGVFQSPLTNGSFTTLFKGGGSTKPGSPTSADLQLGYSKYLDSRKRWSLDITPGLNFASDQTKPSGTFSAGITQYNFLPEGDGIDLDYPRFALTVGTKDVKNLSLELQLNLPSSSFFPQFIFNPTLNRVDGSSIFQTATDVTNSDGTVIAGGAQVFTGMTDVGFTFNPNFNMGRRVPLLAIKPHAGLEWGINPREELVDPINADAVAGVTNFAKWHAGAKLLITPGMFTQGNDDTVDIVDLVRSEVGGSTSFIDIDLQYVGGVRTFSDKGWTWCSEETGECAPRSDTDYNDSTQKENYHHEQLNPTTHTLSLSATVAPLNLVKKSPVKFNFSGGIETPLNGPRAGSLDYFVRLGAKFDFGGPWQKKTD